MEKLWNVPHKESRTFGGGISMISKVKIITADNFVTFENKINACIAENLGDVRDVKFYINDEDMPITKYFALIILEGLKEEKVW